MSIRCWDSNFLRNKTYRKKNIQTNKQTKQNKNKNKKENGKINKNVQIKPMT